MIDLTGDWFPLQRDAFRVETAAGVFFAKTRTPRVAESIRRHTAKALKAGANVPIFDTVQWDGKLWIVHPWIEGTLLRDLPAGERRAWKHSVAMRRFKALGTMGDHDGNYLIDTDGNLWNLDVGDSGAGS